MFVKGPWTERKEKKKKRIINRVGYRVAAQLKNLIKRSDIFSKIISFHHRY